MTVYLLAGGGTAGHVNPLLSVADALRARDPEDVVLVLGTREGLEARLVPERGYELLTIDKLPFPRRLDRASFAFPHRFAATVRRARSLIREHRVDVVAGFGGYASAPAYVAAAREGVPFVVHEANALPGLANRLGARRAAAVGVTFRGTPLRRAEHVGMPLRTEIVELDRAAYREQAGRFFDLDPQRPVLLVVGGSLGAQRLNAAMAQSWPEVLDAGWQILHASGNREGVVDPAAPGYAVHPYIDRMDLAFALADVVLARAGSSTVSELSALGLPAIYVPMAVGNGEQRLNAASAVDAGAAILIDDTDFDATAMREIVIPLLRDGERVQAMATAAEGIGIRTGTENVVAQLDRALAGRG